MDNVRPVDLLFPQMKEERENGICPFCKKKVNVNELRNEINKEEYRISGMCQKCQDDFFGKDTCEHYEEK